MLYVQHINVQHKLSFPSERVLFTTTAAERHSDAVQEELKEGTAGRIHHAGRQWTQDTREPIQLQNPDTGKLPFISINFIFFNYNSFY